MLFTFLLSLSVDVQYPGFAHFSNWDGISCCTPTTELYQLKDLHTGYNRYIDSAVAKDLCASQPGCNALGGVSDPHYKYNVDSLRQTQSDDTYDVFLAYNASLVPSAICKMDAPGCHSAVKFPAWLSCQVDTFDKIIATFQLPPDLIYSSCMRNPSCVGFRVKNDMTAGDLFGVVTRPHGYFAGPWTTDQSKESPVFKSIAI